MVLLMICSMAVSVHWSNSAIEFAAAKTKNMYGWFLVFACYPRLKNVDLD